MESVEKSISEHAKLQDERAKEIEEMTATLEQTLKRAHSLNMEAEGLGARLDTVEMSL